MAERPGKRVNLRLRRVLGLTLALAFGLVAVVLANGSAGAEQGPTVSAAAGAQKPGDGRGGFQAKAVGSFDSPVYVNGPRGAGGLIFVVEQPGQIKLIKEGRKLAGSFLDIRDKVEAGGERGLLSVAFPRSYAKSRRFYVFYTDHKGDLTIAEYRTSRHSPRDAKEGSGRIVLKVRHRQNANHNGGQLQFGPDGYLYISTGDGGAGGDPPENAQNKNVLLGKILRIDPRRPKAKGRKQGKGYRIPRSNPFVGRKGADEVFSYGLRNPYRFSFDGKRIAIGDVGQSAREEVDYETLRGANGANFGWDAFEGSIRFDSDDASPPPRRTAKPIFDYTHDRGCAITGGYVSHDKRIGALRGRYLYADFCEGQIRSLIPTTSGARDDRSAGLPRQSGLSSFGTDTRKRIWFTNLNSGRVYVLTPRR